MKPWAKFSGAWGKERRERVMNEEMQAHLDELAARHVAAGMSPEEARFAAHREFGNVTGLMEQTRETWALVWLEGLWRDVCFSARSLRRSLAFSVAVVATLALCIWANTAVLSVLYGLVLKPLPFPEAGQLVDVYNMRPKAGQMRQQLSVTQYLEYKAQADLFTGFGLWSGWMFNIGDEAGTSRYVGMRVTSDYFTVLGVQPLMGRFFTEEESRGGQDYVVVLTQSFWEKQFNGDPDIVGKEVRLTGRAFTVVGVLPRSFERLSVAPVLMKPFEWAPNHVLPHRRLDGMASMYARVKPGVSHEAALAQLQAIEQRSLESVADPAMREYLTNGGHRMGLKQIREEQVASLKNGLLLLQGGALFVLLLGCVNVASLMLARANTRQAEFAVRQALGASRLVLARKLFAESMLLALAGSALGLVLAWTSLRVINTYTDKIVFGIPPVQIDGGMLGLTLAVSFGVALIIGMLPVLRVWRTGSLLSAIQSGSRGASRSGGVRSMSGVLVVAQVALAFILLIGAGLLMRSFAKVMAINPGFDAAQVIHARVAYNFSYADLASQQSLQARILEKMREIPGVESVAYSVSLPGFAEDKIISLPLRGMSRGQDSTYPTAIIFHVSPEYFPTMGIRLLEGRNFTSQDTLPGARQVFIVDRKFAERHFPGRSAVGQLFALGPPNQKPEEMPVIVGVAEVAKVSNLEKQNVEPYVYLPMGAFLSNGLSVELRTARSFDEIIPLIRAQLRSVDAALPIYQEQTMQMRLEDAAANRRGVMWLLGAFAGIALTLSAVGLYGMLAYDVTQRTKEIGIRGAIGATRIQIVTMILRQGLWKAGTGLAIGLCGAFFLSRYIGSLLFEVNPKDPIIFFAVASTLLLVALVASWLPARRAAKVNPLVALRCD